MRTEYFYYIGKPADDKIPLTHEAWVLFRQRVKTADDMLNAGTIVKVESTREKVKKFHSRQTLAMWDMFMPGAIGI